MSIDIKSAVQSARQHALGLFEPEALPNLALEEITFDELQNQWLVTLGFDSPHQIKRKTNGQACFRPLRKKSNGSISNSILMQLMGIWCP